ncbi:hypothetical protein [uncultured Campylobacter sp.]|uniref:hypothetical protein n=1 Tax=uncultured Campylobacter sp. TaxID=218934 RepID=UPI0026101126|nr:hypothetical protein [uncultured Campylobacter sp.]
MIIQSKSVSNLNANTFNNSSSVVNVKFSEVLGQNVQANSIKLDDESIQPSRYLGYQNNSLEISDDAFKKSILELQSLFSSAINSLKIRGFDEEYEKASAMFNTLESNFLNDNSFNKVLSVSEFKKSIEPLVKDVSTLSKYEKHKDIFVEKSKELASKMSAFFDNSSTNLATSFLDILAYIGDKLPNSALDRINENIEKVFSYQKNTIEKNKISDEYILILSDGTIIKTDDNFENLDFVIINPKEQVKVSAKFEDEKYDSLFSMKDSENDSFIKIEAIESKRLYKNTKQSPLSELLNSKDL